VKGAQKSVKRIRKDIFAEQLGYKDESNPFGDQTLTDNFVWKKKNEYLSAAGLFKKTTKDDQVECISSKIREIGQVKKRRDEREVERALLEKQRQEHDKEMHDEEYEEWLSKEEKFHLENAKARSLIRVQQGRERPIDLVNKGLAIAEGDEFNDMTILDKYPHQIFDSMTSAEVDEMLVDIQNFQKNDIVHKGFWKAMGYVCQDAVEIKIREKTVGNMRVAGGFGVGVAEGVASEIHDLLSSKSIKELSDMQGEIQESVQKGGEGVDTQFFDAVASKIPLYIARAEIELWHDRAVKNVEDWADSHREEGKPSTDAPDVPKPGRAADLLPESESDGEDLSPVLEPLSVLNEGDQGYSPVLEPLTAYDPDELLDPDEDARILRQVRETLIDALRDPVAEPASRSREIMDRSKDDEFVARERAKGMGDMETGFNARGVAGDEIHGEIDLPQKHYEWEDKYKPRKPRFFNRVKTGFEWNKYNQTHYDHDNPPPKIVQGYKFNIFYPDLIDKSKAPTYYLEKADSAETVTLRFHAGPPYEDVAFKIVNREWNLSHRFGFRVVFDRGVLQLYFNFKRWRYRR